MLEVETDPLVSCPIVCGEYMRATGFFYSTTETTYLVTARHNCLPTTGADLVTGDVAQNFQTDDVLPTIDIYMRTSTGFDVERVDIRTRDGVVQTPEIDVLCVPIESSPEEYEYHVWDESEVSAPQDAGDSLTDIGFNYSALPDDDEEYAVEMYRKQIGTPVSLPLANPLSGETDLSRFGLMPAAIDEKSGGNDKEYNGFSGAPIFDDGIVGIHSLNTYAPAAAVEQTSDGEYMFISYTRAGVLPKLLR